jgi:flavorubredoxin
MEQPLGTMPREIAPGLYWLGECMKLTFQGKPLHAYNSAFLLVGNDASMLIEAGHPEQLPALEQQLDDLLNSGVPPLRYLFVTHTETPHASGVGRILAKYPDATVCGDLSDLHLVLPQFTDRMRHLDPGSTVDVGGVEFQIVEAIFRDHITTRWGFDSRSRTVFAGDGFSYSHYHEAAQCGRLAEEVDDLDVPDMVALFARLAFNWTTHTDIEPYIDRLNQFLFDELDVRIIAPTHGLPIGDPRKTMSLIEDGLRIGSGRHNLQPFAVQPQTS